MKKNGIFRMFMIVALFCMIFTTEIYAVEWWDQATKWKDQGKTDVEISDNVLGGISETIEIIGTAVIAIATVVVGIKYVFGTVQGKVEAKESLMNLIVACVFFFGWTSIRGLIITGNATAKGGFSLSFFSGDLKVTFASIFTLLVMLGKVITVLAVGYMGVKYIFAGADAKAQLKQKSPALIIGIILIFCATNFLGLLSKVITDILSK